MSLHPRTTFYLRHYALMLEPLSALSRHGVAVDKELIKTRRAEIDSECKELVLQIHEMTGANTCLCTHDTREHERKRVNVLAGLFRKDGKPRAPRWKFLHPCRECGCKDHCAKGTILTGAKDLSNDKLKEYLYGTLSLPQQMEKKKITVGSDALRALELMCARQAETIGMKGKLFWRRKPKFCKKLLGLCLRHRVLAKQRTVLNVRLLDTDDRLRCQYGFTTQTGRLNSKKNPKGKGMNLQNPDRRHRDCFVADPGTVMLEADLSQAEKRVVDCLTGDPKLIAYARKAPHEFDAHTFNARVIFSAVQGKQLQESDITKDMRYLGKRCVHASNYGTGENKISKVLLKDGYVRTPTECGLMKAAYLSFFSAIPAWQKSTRAVVLGKKGLTNSWGRHLDFSTARIDDELFRKAYAFVPQSEVGDLLNQYGLVPLYYFIKEKGLEARINLQVHDAVVISCPPSEVYRVMRFLNRAFNHPRTYTGPSGRKVELTIPEEFKLGANWKGEFEWKKLPPKAEVRVALKSLRRSVKTAQLKRTGPSGSLRKAA